MPDKQLNHALEFTPAEKKTLRQVFDYIGTTERNIHILLKQQGYDYAKEFIRLCRESINQGYISKDLHNIIQNKNFITLFDNFGDKVYNQDQISQAIIHQLKPIIDRLSKQLPGLSIVGKIELPQKKISESNEFRIQKSLKEIADEFKKQNIAYNIFDNGSQDSDIAKIKNIIKKNIGGNKSRKKCYQLICNYIDSSTVGKSIGEVPANWNIFVEGVYRVGGVEMPPRDSLKMNFVQKSLNIDDYVGKKMTRSEFLKIQNLSEDAINNNDIILGRYTGSDKDYRGKSFFTVGRSIDIATQTEYVDGELEDGLVYKLFIKSKMENRDSDSQKKFLFSSDVIID